MKLNVSRIFISLILAICFSPATVICAQEYTIEAVGTYMIGDGPEENINIAKERARTEAFRQASEQAGVYVESYSKVQNAALTHDDVEIISAQVCKVKNEKIEPVIVENHIQIKCSILAVVNTANIDLKAILADKKAVTQVKELQNKINNLQIENQKLKEQYKNTTDTYDREQINKQIIENGVKFNRSAQELPVYIWGKWHPGIDVNSIQYDKENNIVIFNSKTKPNANGSYMSYGFKIYVNRNSVEGLYSACVAYPGAPLEYVGKGHGEFIEKPIEPDSYEEVLQHRIYNYLGIKNFAKNNTPDWKYVYTATLSNGVVYTYYVDLNNYRYDAKKDSYAIFVKQILPDNKGINEYISEYYCNFNTHSVGVSEVGNGYVGHWENMDYKKNDFHWDLMKIVYETAETFVKR